MRIFVAIFLLIGLGLLGTGVWLAQEQRALRDRAVEVPATVVRNEASTDSDGTTWAPVYGFTYDGDTREVRASVSTSHPPDVGSTATVLVDPDDPSEVSIDTFMETWFLSLLLGGIGAAFTAAALIVIVVWRSSMRAASAMLDHVEQGRPVVEPPAGNDDERGSSPHSGPFL